MIFFDFVSKTNSKCSKKNRKILYDFLWFCLKKIETRNVKKKQEKFIWFSLILFQKNGSSLLMRFLFLSTKSIYIKCIDFHAKNTLCHSHKPHLTSILMRILFLSLKSMYIFTITIIIWFYHFCIVNFNSFIISIVEINVYQSIDFHGNNNRLFYASSVILVLSKPI